MKSEKPIDKELSESPILVMNKKVWAVIVVVIIISSVTTILFLNSNNTNLSTTSYGYDGDIFLYIGVNKNPIIEGEPLTLSFTLKNEGQNLVRLVPLSAGFDILITDVEGTEIFTYRALMGVNVYGNNSFVELSPTGELFYDYIVNTDNINMHSGNIYLLKGVYSTFGNYLNVTDPYWDGEIVTNEIEIQVA